MRLNKFLSQHTHLSRRQADLAISNARVTVNHKTAVIGLDILDDDLVTIDNEPISIKHVQPQTVLLNKPVGYVCSRDGQGSPTVYDLIPEHLQNLNIAGRLDKDSCGLVVLTSDGDLLNQLTHPSYNKQKVYEVETDRELTEKDLNMLNVGINIGDNRLSKFKKTEPIGLKTYLITIEEGRNRQIRRTLKSINFNVASLKRLSIGEFTLDEMNEKAFKVI